jgi:cysteine desulfurase/selenocysteine lyase
MSIAPPDCRLEPTRFSGAGADDHGAPLAYLDNAATTQVAAARAGRHAPLRAHDRANIHRGVHTLSQRATDAFEAGAQHPQALRRRRPGHELVFTSGTTEALNLVAHGLSTPGPQVGGDPAGRRDHRQRPGAPRQPGAVAAAARRCGATLRILRPDADGRLHAVTWRAC